jgi:hypothetical protein
MLYGVAAHLGAGRRRDHGAIPAAVALLSRALAARAHPAARGAGHRLRVARASRCWRWRATPARARGRPRRWALRCCSARCSASLLRGDRQAAHRQRVAAAHQRADQPVGPGAGHAAGLWQALSFDFGSVSRRPGACWCSTRWPPAWSRCGCGCRACATCRRRAPGSSSACSCCRRAAPSALAGCGVLLLGEPFGGHAGGVRSAGAGRPPCPCWRSPGRNRW